MRYLIVLSLCWLVIAADASAQLFGARTLGQPLGTPSGGEVQGSERFVRGNRGRAAFVGSDRRDTQEFVGSELGRTQGSIVSSLAGLRKAPDRTAEINTPLAANAPNPFYPPRLQVATSDDDPPAATPEERSQQITQQLRQAECFGAGCHFEVSMAARTATLQGVVLSAKERDLAELLVLFEPGISQVRNRLQVRQDSSSDRRKEPSSLEPLPLAPPRPGPSY